MAKRARVAKLPADEDDEVEMFRSLLRFRTVTATGPLPAEGGTSVWRKILGSC